MYKVKHRIAPKLMCVLFKENERICNRTYDFKAVQYGTETLSFMGPKIWSLVPSYIKNSYNARNI